MGESSHSFFISCFLSFQRHLLPSLFSPRSTGFSPSGRLGAAEAADLIADPGRLFEFLEGNGQLELLLQPFDGSDGAFVLHFAAPTQEEAELGAFGLAIGLVV